ncbi:hypothetical protein FDECE_14832 [Fusarium decemcellulare]|nr:hypothetical protein FDECE_14832 [Fusarium decemcellulare]
MKYCGLLLFGAATSCWLGEARTAPPREGVYPEVTDTRFATESVAKFFRGYFTAKTLRDAESWLSHYHPRQAVLYDSTLGAPYTSRAVLDEELPKITKAWPDNGTAYPQRILGDRTSAVVVNLDSQELFGDELRMISAYDFRDGKVTRQCDYWDGRRNSVSNNRFPDEQYPYGLGLETVQERAATPMRRIAARLSDALATGNADAAADCFSTDALFEDATTRLRVEGRHAIRRYLNRATDKLPYGQGSSLRHVLGSSRGGGYEWGTQGKEVRNGITALELDGEGNVVRLTTVWDASRMHDEAIQALVTLAIEP